MNRVNLAFLFGVLSVCSVAAQPQCDPIACCGIPCTSDLLTYECGGGAQPHFALDDGTTLTEVKGVVATFSVSGTSGVTTIGSSGVFAFTIGTSESRVRYETSNGGECVEVKSLGFPTGFPAAVSVNGRGLDLSKKGAFYCREPGRNLICFTVKGQVTGSPVPFPPDICGPGRVADRVEAACGVVN